MSVKSVVFRGSGHSLPGRVMRNEDFRATIDTSDEWIRTRTGIRERRLAGPEETSATLGQLASRHALDAAGLSADEVDMIVCATVTPDLMCPSNACLIQSALGCRQIPAFDISAACSGFVYAISVAQQYILTGAARNVLVVGTDTLSKVVDYKDRNSCILFGDGAGAVVLTASEQAEKGIRFCRLSADGAGGPQIQVPSRVTKHIANVNGVTTSPDFLKLNGREVFRFAVGRMAELMEEAFRVCRELGEEVKLLIPHQVNQRIIDNALESTQFPADKVMVNIDRYGNTSAASIPIALDEALRAGRIKQGDTIVLVAFGGGLTWAGAVITL